MVGGRSVARACWQVLAICDISCATTITGADAEKAGSRALSLSELIRGGFICVQATGETLWELRARVTSGGIGKFSCGKKRKNRAFP